MATPNIKHMTIPNYQNGTLSRPEISAIVGNPINAAHLESILSNQIDDTFPIQPQNINHIRQARMISDMQTLGNIFHRHVQNSDGVEVMADVAEDYLCDGEEFSNQARERIRRSAREMISAYISESRSGLQYMKTGRNIPQFVHPIMVAKLAKQFREFDENGEFYENLIISGLFHDQPEDTFRSLETSLERVLVDQSEAVRTRFNTHIVEPVELMARDEVLFSQYLQRLGFLEDYPIEIRMEAGICKGGMDALFNVLTTDGYSHRAMLKELIKRTEIVGTLQGLYNTQSEEKEAVNPHLSNALKKAIIHAAYGIYIVSKQRADTAGEELQNFQRQLANRTIYTHIAAHKFWEHKAIPETRPNITSGGHLDGLYTELSLLMWPSFNSIQSYARRCKRSVNDIRREVLDDNPAGRLVADTYKKSQELPTSNSAIKNLHLRAYAGRKKFVDRIDKNPRDRYITYRVIENLATISIMEYVSRRDITVTMNTP